MSSFVGRGPERLALVEALADRRLVTLVGPPGVGKTRLAVEAATVAAASFPDGARWIDLAPLADPGAVVATLARALGVQDQAGRPRIDSVVAHLREQRLVVVLDNCEHLIATVAAVTQALLEACGGLTVLATSREALCLPGERRFEVAPLSLPPLEADAASVAAAESGRLFCERAAAVRAGFALDESNAVAVSEICRRLDGLPLAIELAAARVAVLSAAEIASRLDGQISVLEGATRPLARHHTMEGALAWSYELLSPAEQVLLRRLAVFSGGATLEAVASVCAIGEVAADAVLDLVSGLVAKSLVVARTTATEPARYALLETVRAFAADRLAKADERPQLAERHARWFVQWADAAEPGLTGADQAGVLSRLDADYDNLTAALRWTLSSRGDSDALRLASALTIYWRVRSLFGEGRGWLEAAIESSPDAPADLRARGAWGVAFMALMVSERAEPHLAEALALYRKSGDAKGQGRCLLLLANSRLVDQGPHAALGLLHDAATLAVHAADPWCAAHALALAGRARTVLGERPAAEALLEEALSIARKANDAQGLRISLVALGQMALAHGSLERADSLLDEALGVIRQLDEPYGAAVALIDLGQVAIGRGDYPRAGRLLQEAVALNRRIDSPRMAAHAWSICGHFSLGMGDVAGARRTFDEAATLAARAGDSCWHQGLHNQASLTLAEGDPESARSLLQEALVVARARGDQHVVATLVRELGYAACVAGRFDQALTHYLEAVALFEAADDLRMVVGSLEEVAGLEARAGRAGRAVRLFAAAQALQKDGGYKRFPRAQAAYEAALQGARADLDEAAFLAAWEQGAELSPSEAVRYAVCARGTRKRPMLGWESLTRTELEVVRLAAEGLTNPEIAERLFVARSTVQNHLSHIFTKLGVSSRVELALEAQRRGVAEQPRNGSSPS